jgi:hypothetical protein
MSEECQFVRLALEHITENERLQGRNLKRAVVVRYAEALRRGERMPPVTLVRDSDDNYYLVDGYHRLAATRELNGVDMIDAEIVDGTFDDALWHAWGANLGHGLPRTREQRRAILEAVLQHPQCRKKSDREIAKHVGCDHKTVGAGRRKLARVRGEFPTSRRKLGSSKKQILKACQILASADPEQFIQFEPAEYAILRASYEALAQLLALADSSKMLASTSATVQ